MTGWTPDSGVTPEVYWRRRRRRRWLLLAAVILLIAVGVAALL